MDLYDLLSALGLVRPLVIFAVMALSMIGVRCLVSLFCYLRCRDNDKRTKEHNARVVELNGGE